MIRVLYGIVVILLLAIGWKAVAMKQAYDFLSHESGVGFFGAEEDAADVFLMVFVDYTSSLSQDINAELLQAVEEDGRTQARFYPLPQPSALSIRAARLILAASMQGKYQEMHDALMRNNRPLSDEIVRDMAARNKIDAGKLLADEKSPEISRRLAEIVKASRRLGIAYTPSVLANRRTLFYSPDVAPDAGAYRKLIEEVRS